MENNSWIKLYRKFLEWEWYDDVNTKVLFLHILLRANYKDKKWRGEVIHRGEWITSLEHMSQETGLSVQQVRTSIDKLKSTNEITYLGTPNYSKITVKNYKKYQQATSSLTNEQQTINKRLTTTKERKKERNIYICSFEKFWNLYPRKIGKKKAESAYKKVATSKNKEKEILKGLGEYIKKWRAENTDSKFIPHPTTWINQGRWEDEVEISKEVYKKNSREHENHWKAIKEQEKKDYQERYIEDDDGGLVKLEEFMNR